MFFLVFLSMLCFMTVCINLYGKIYRFHCAKTIVYRGLSRKRIESVFRHFTKFNCTKADSSQNSVIEKRILYKIQYQKNRLFTKFSIRKVDFSQNSISEKQTFHKIQYQKNGHFAKFIIGKTDSLQNSTHRHESFHHFLGISL